MTHFEYLSIAVSIIFAISLGRQVAAVPQVLAKDRRDALHLGHFAGLFVMQIQFWWRMWGFNDVEHWDFLGFFMLVTVVLLYYLATNLLVPGDDAEAGSWREHFERVHKPFHGVVALAWASGAGVSHYLVGIDGVPVPLAITVGLFVAAIFVEKRWFHAVVLVWWLMLLTLVSVGLQTGMG